MLGQTKTHATLLARLSQGDDAEAWRELSDRYGELIRGFARRRGLQSSDCDDLVQEVLLALTSNMPGFRYDPERGRFRGYLKTIASRGISRRLCQKQGGGAQGEVETAAADVMTDPAAEEHWEAEWRQHHLRRAMRVIRVEFSESDLAAFEAYAGHGREASEVAESLGMSVDSVYQAKSRILKRLGQVEHEPSSAGPLPRRDDPPPSGSGQVVPPVSTAPRSWKETPFPEIWSGNPPMTRVL